MFQSPGYISAEKAYKLTMQCKYTRLGFLVISAGSYARESALKCVCVCVSTELNAGE